MADELRSEAPAAGSRRWKIAGFVLVAVLSVVIGFAFVALSSQAVTITHMREGYRDAERDLEVLMKLLPALRRGMGQKELVTLLQEQNPGMMVVDAGRTVQIGQLVFGFDLEGRLARIERAGTGTNAEPPHRGLDSTP